MPVVLEEKLLLIHMVDGEAMEVEPSLEKIPAKLIDLLLMLPDGLLNLWLQINYAKDAWFKLLMVLVLLTLFLSLLTPMDQFLKDSQILI